MISYFLFALAIFFLAGGSFLIFQGSRVAKEEDNVVLVNDFKQQPQPIIENSSQQQIQNLLEEKKRLAEALEREVSSKEMKTLMEQDRKEFSERIQQLGQAEESIQHLTKDNDALSKKLDAKEREIHNVQEQMEKLRQDFQKSFSQPPDWVKKVEEQTKQVSSDHDLLETLRGENTLLYQSKEEMTWQMRELERELAVLKDNQDRTSPEIGETLRQLTSENKNIKEQLNASERYLIDLQKDLEVASQIKDQKLNEAYTAISALKSKELTIENQEEVGRLREELGNKQAKMEILSQENQKLVDIKARFEKELEDIKAINVQWQEKNRLGEYALTKSRAQAIGLERICEDFKNQIEELNRQLEELKALR
jgi:chromosome segregation ATPase